MTPLSPAADPPGCMPIAGAFALLMVPVYLVFRFFVKLVRQAYGFDRPDDADLPPLRVCFACNNTVLEDDFVHCPYCGSGLPPVGGSSEDEQAADGSAGAAGQESDPSPGSRDAGDTAAPPPLPDATDDADV